MARLKFNGSAKKPKVYHLALNREELMMVQEALDYKISELSDKALQSNGEVEILRKELEIEYFQSIRKELT